MRKIYLLLLLFIPTVVFAQTYNMPGGTINTCSGNFYDPGGSGANYANNQNITTTFCSNAGNCITINFTAFNTESGWDYVYIYDGNSIASPLIGTYSGTTSPGTVTSSGSCLTVRFTSDGSNVSSGWAATISCGTCPPLPPQNCNGAIGVCNDAVFAGNASGFGIQELNAANTGCLSTFEHQTTWFGFSPTMAGSLTFTITPTAGAIDYDFAIWGPYNTPTCPMNSAPARCSYAASTGPTGLLAGAGDVSEGTGGDRFVNPLWFLPADVGKVYYLVVDNFTANATPFTLDWTLSNSALLDCTPPLPVTISNFNGQAEGERNYVYWSTASEHNNDYFTLFRSNDGVNFTEVTRVEPGGDGSGNSNSVLEYGFYDEHPFYPTTYYKLVQTDKDGKESNFPYIVITNTSQGSTKVNKVFPSPSDGLFNVDVIVFEPTTLLVEVTNLMGGTVYQKEVMMDGSGVIQIDGSEWGNGMYTIGVRDVSKQIQVYNSKIIKK